MSNKGWETDGVGGQPDNCPVNLETNCDYPLCDCPPRRID